MLNKVEGIVLKTQDYGETNKIVTLFSKQYGKLTAISRGAKKPRSRMNSVSQPFIQGEFLLYMNKGLSTMQQGEILQSFRHIREDIVKTAYAAYVVELTDRLCEQNESDYYLYEQLYRTLEWINDKEEFIIPVVMYELKMFKKGGFAPVVTHCVNCNSNKNAPFYFSIDEGGLLCRNCSHLDQNVIRLDNVIVKLFTLLSTVGIEQVGNVSVKKENQDMLQQILDLYYDKYGGYQLKSKRFLEQLNLLEE